MNKLDKETSSDPGHVLTLIPQGDMFQSVVHFQRRIPVAEEVLAVTTSTLLTSFQSLNKSWVPSLDASSDIWSCA